MALQIMINKKQMYISVVAFLFFFFFASPALSPAVNENTIYLYWFIPFFDIHFVKFFINLIRNTINLKYFIVLFGFFLLCTLELEFFLFIKIFSIILCLLYISYTKKNGNFRFLYWGININIVVAIIQFVLFYIDRSYAYMLGPTNIASLLWGDFATKTNTNMYSIWNSGWIRVCGWSREAGFFAALLNIYIIQYLFGDEKKTKIQTVLFFIGFVISFSKMSILIVPMLLTVKFSKFINKIPFSVVFICWILITVIISNRLNVTGYYTGSHESIMHRMIGYSIIFELPLKHFFIGFGNIRNISSTILQKYMGLNWLIHRNYADLCGIPYIIQKLGMIGLIIYAVLLNYAGMTSSGILLLIFATFDVDFFTATSFVVLAYWVSLDKKIFYNANRKINIKDNNRYKTR